MLQEADGDNDRSLDEDEFYAYLEEVMYREVRRLEEEEAEAAERAAMAARSRGRRRAARAPAMSRGESDALFASLDKVGLGCVVALHYRSSTSYQIHEHTAVYIRYITPVSETTTNAAAPYGKDGNGELSLKEIKAGLEQIKKTTELPMGASRLLHDAPIATARRGLGRIVALR